MRKLLFISACLLAGQLHAQSKLGIGQYAYIRSREPMYVSPIVQYQGGSGWYAEARYNYEDLHTFSLYGGHTFSKEREQGWSWSVTPMAGLVQGRLRGASAGLNAELDYNKWYCSTQSQYFVSPRDRQENFFFSWSEAGYRATGWLYTGLSLQHTKPYGMAATIEPGLFACFTFRQWSVPVYCFLPSREPCFFVLGVTREWRYPKSERTKTSKPAYPRQSRSTGY